MTPRLFHSLVKLAGFQEAPALKYQEKLDEHFSEAGTEKWKGFRTSLRSPRFVDAVQQDLRADKKLRRFSENVGRHLQARGVPVYNTPSQSIPSKHYKVKYHPDIDRFSCNCGDWTYVRSVQTRNAKKDCKHIKAVKDGQQREELTKTAVRGRAAAIVARTLKAK